MRTLMPHIAMLSEQNLASPQSPLLYQCFQNHHLFNIIDLTFEIILNEPTILFHIKVNVPFIVICSFKPCAVATVHLKVSCPSLI